MTSAHPDTSPNTELNATAQALAQALIRHAHDGERERVLREPLYDSRFRGLSDGTAARKLGASVDTVAPGMRSCPYHFHLAQEEMFVILQGTGTLRVAGEMLPLKAGDVVFIPPGPQYPHQIINSSGEPLSYLSISTQERPEVCVYPDSGKTAAFPGGGGAALIGRIGDSLDYWAGEP